MSSSRPLAWGALFAAGIAAIAVISACSSSSTGKNTVAEDGGTDALISGDGGGGVNGTCIQACLDQHPKAPDKLEAVDTCVTDKCDQPCNAESDAGAPEAGLCGTEIGSGASKACDDCLTASCCSAWTGCFADKDCLAFNDCLQACPAE